MGSITFFWIQHVIYVNLLISRQLIELGNTRGSKLLSEKAACPRHFTSVTFGYDEQWSKSSFYVHFNTIRIRNEEPERETLNRYFKSVIKITK